MFPRLYQKQNLYLRHKQGKSVEEFESYNRVKYSYKLLYVCTVMWTTLVVSYFVSAFAPLFVGKSNFLQKPAYSMLSECTVDVIIKVIYLHVINDVQDAIFDDKARSRRRLEELRSMMNVVWESSSDIIVISVRKGDTDIVTTMVSPTFLRKEKTEQNQTHRDKNALLFELKLPNMDAKLDASSIKIESMSLDFHEKQARIEETSDIVTDSYKTESILSLADVVAQAWRSSEQESLFMHDLVTLNGSSIQAEARINRFQEHSLIVVLRDITERFMRFEAEKKSCI